MELTVRELRLWDGLAALMILRAGWDPRVEWDGFPLDGGVKQWAEEVRGTSLASAVG